MSGVGEPRPTSLRAMHETERNRLLGDIRRFQLARGDMLQVIAAVEALNAERVNGYLCRALETAIVVCYARPFGSRNAVGPLSTNWPPISDDPELHAELMRLRDQVYAHTDKTEARQVVEVSELLGLDSPAYTEGWHAIDREKLPAIAELARRLEACLAAAVAEHTAELGTGGTE